MFFPHWVISGHSSTVERYFWVVDVGGSNPSVPIKRGSEMVSHESHKLVTAGSIPVPARLSSLD